MPTFSVWPAQIDQLHIAALYTVGLFIIMDLYCIVHSELINELEYKPTICRVYVCKFPY